MPQCSSRGCEILKQIIGIVKKIYQSFIYRIFRHRKNLKFLDLHLQSITRINMEALIIAHDSTSVSFTISSVRKQVFLLFPNKLRQWQLELC